MSIDPKITLNNAKDCLRDRGWVYQGHGGRYGPARPGYFYKMFREIQPGCSLNQSDGNQLTIEVFDFSELPGNLPEPLKFTLNLNASSPGHNWYGIDVSYKTGEELLRRLPDDIGTVTRMWATACEGERA